MDFKLLSDVFAGCIFSDNLRLNLSVVHQSIQKYEEATQPEASADHWAALYLVKAVYSIARGDFAQASTEVKKVKELASVLSERWQLRYEAYKLFHLSQKRYPPLLRFRPDSFEASSTIADAENDVGNAKVQMENLKHRAAQGASSALDRLELDCLRMMTFEGIEHLALQPFFHSTYPNIIPKKLPYQQMARALAQRPTFPQHMLDCVDASGLTTTSSHFRILNLETLLTREAPDAFGLLSQIMDEHTASRDEVGIALMHVMHADHLYSPPTTSPLALNLVTEGTLTGYEVDFWDESDFESGHRLQHNTEASEYYDKAFHLLQKHGCMRGQGAICLRRACILHMQSLQDARSGDASTAARNRAEAYKELRAAMIHFDLDVAYLDLISAHKILLNITTGQRSDAITEAQAIGNSCRAHGNVQLSRFICTLMLRFERQQWLNDGLTGNFLICCQCAQACARSAADKIYEHQAAIAIARVHCEFGSIPAAQAALEAARQTLATAQDVIRQHGNSCRGMSDGLQSYFARVDNAVQGRASDPSQMRAVTTKINEDLSPDYRSAAMTAMSTLTRRRLEYTQAVAEGQAALAVSDFDGYTSRLEAFVEYVASCELTERSVAGFHVMALCLLGRYEAARAALPSALSAGLGGTGQDKLFDAVTSTTVDGFTLSMEGAHQQKVLEHSIAFCVWTRDWSQAATVLSQVLRSSPEYVERLADERQRVNWQAQAEVGAIYEHNDGLDEALKWYLLASRTLERCRIQTIDVEGRLANMSSMNSAELFAGMVRVALRLHRVNMLSIRVSNPCSYGLRGTEWRLQALLFAEQGRARLLLDMLTVTNEQIDKGAFERWRRCSYVFRQYEDLLYNRRPVLGPTVQARGINEPEEAALQGAIQQQYEQNAENGIDSRWSAAYELLARTDYRHDFSAGFTLIAEDTLVLHYNIYTNGSIIFALTSEGIVRVKETSLTRMGLQKRVLAYQKRARDSPPDVGFSDPQLARTISEWLASHFLLPFQDLVDDKSHVIFIPSQEMFSFPLCSLPHRGKPLVHQKCCSMVPSLIVLQQLASRTRPRSQIQTSILANEDREIAASNFGAAVASGLYGSPPCMTSGMSSAMFETKYREADLVYFVTHGRHASSGSSPWQANLLLDPKQQYRHYPNAHDSQVIRIINLADFRTNAAAVIFGACVAARGHTTIGNDMIGFSHAVLESGAQCFVGALWSVSDWATMLIMLLFHSTLSANRENKSIAQCLQTAQSRFHSLNIESAIALLRQAEASYVAEARSGAFGDSSGWFDRCHHSVLDLIDDMEEAGDSFNFQDPFYWAAWTVVGYGDVRLSKVSATPSPQSQSTVEGNSCAKGNREQQQSELAASQRPAPTPLPRIPEQTSSGPLVPLSAIHSVDSAGLPHYRRSSITRPLPYRTFPPPPALRSSPPPPQLPPRPLAAPPTTSVPQLPHRPSSLPAYDPQTYAQATTTGSQDPGSVVRRRPLSQVVKPAQSLPPPAYSPPPVGSTSSENVRKHQQGAARPKAMQYPPPPSWPAPQTNTPAQAQRQMQSQPVRPQVAQPSPARQAQMHAQQLQAKAANGRRVSYPQQQTSTDVSQSQFNARASLAASRIPGTPPLKGQQAGFTGPPAAQPKQSKIDKIKKLAKTPAGKRVIRVGTGMVVASVTGGLLGAEALDWGGGGDADVGGDFSGGDFASEDFGEGDFEEVQHDVEVVESAEYEEAGVFEGQVTIDAGGEEYSYAGEGFGVEAVDGGDYAGDAATFEDELVMDGGGDGEMYETGGGGGGDDKIPGQIGPCFEDNVYVSAAMP